MSTRIPSDFDIPRAGFQMKTAPRHGQTTSWNKRLLRERWLSFLTSLGSSQQSAVRHSRSQLLRTFWSCLASVHPDRKASSKPSCALSSPQPGKSVFEKKYQKQVRKLYLLWSEKLHFQGKSSSCRPPAWWCKGPELWETRHSGKNSVKMYYEWINSFSIGVSSPNQPFVLIESPYEYSGSQLLQLKNVTVQWVTGTWVSVLKKGKSNVRAA